MTKKEIRCTIHNLPNEFIPLVLAEEHWTSKDGISYQVGLESFKIGPQLSGYFVVRYVKGMQMKPVTSAGDDGMFSMQHVIWMPNRCVGDSLNSNLFDIEETVGYLRRLDFHFSDHKVRNPTLYAMTFEAV